MLAAVQNKVVCKPPFMYQLFLVALQQQPPLVQFADNSDEEPGPVTLRSSSHEPDTPEWAELDSDDYSNAQRVLNKKHICMKDIPTTPGLCFGEAKVSQHEF
ncbi:hypothetical protein E1301_Tti022782 [Triplophysa tibetana]|uniref:Uncharacterized protein n=1 Tax=Triplophysa tibetana TaxID=1572043 RepID=A0A5A9PCZ2_9TELE|nr:hypothetical protein E1301_Tti022782 [Triplophysa tibetana]